MKKTNLGRNHLARLFTGNGVEVGVERAHFAKLICEENPDVKLWGVDPWLAYDNYREHVPQEKLDGFFEECKERMKGFNWEPMRHFSVDAATFFENEYLDFVYIDANHDYENTMRDLRAWYPKVKTGGILSGHDYVKRDDGVLKYGVIEAVNDFAKEIGAEIIIWAGDRSPSWSLIK